MTSVNIVTGFVGSVGVRLDNGAALSIKALTDQPTHEHVYAYHQQQGVLVRNAVNPKQTGSADSLMIVSLWGNDIQCTPDTPFLLADGTYKTAADLAVGDLLRTYPRGPLKLTVAPHPLALVKPIPIYDMSVSKPGNFALAAGPYVKAQQQNWT
jgi:hypothetical protein